ncbi:hypothetical protein [Roseovarius sp. EL26]|uniref:hypothetical protein n=1 Tax=Roseovarius sp. EL26 TaxID=2126672 RepID=UPI000EA32F06|nr:hypothetical protein [Roseovarius sp. EL26]
MEWLQLIPEITDALVSAGTLLLGVLVYRRNNDKDDDGESKHDAKINQPVDDQYKQGKDEDDTG